LTADAIAYQNVKGDPAKEKISRPSKYKYLFQSYKQDLTGLPQDYPYNWYLGGKSFLNVTFNVLIQGVP